jgi:hypothetical protein
MHCLLALLDIQGTEGKIVEPDGTGLAVEGGHRRGHTEAS